VHVDVDPHFSMLKIQCLLQKNFKSLQLSGINVQEIFIYSKKQKNNDIKRNKKNFISLKKKEKKSQKVMMSQKKN